MPRGSEHRFAAPAEAVRDALKEALPSVAQRATFWEGEHRVDWSSDFGPTDWGQKMAVTVDAIDARSSTLVMRGRSLGWPPTLFDPSRRRTVPTTAPEYR